jgi:hypothetical protein
LRIRNLRRKRYRRRRKIGSSARGVPQNGISTRPFRRSG